MTAVGYISDTEAFLKALGSLLQHDGVAAFQFSERSPLPPTLSATDLLGGRTQISNVSRIRRINSHPVECDEHSALESISDTADCLNWNGDLDNPNHWEDDCAADVESEIEQDNIIEDRECPEQRDVSAPPNLPTLIRPSPKSKTQAENASMTVNGIETRTKKWEKEM